MLSVLILGCGAQRTQIPLDIKALAPSHVWLASVRNSSGADLRLPDNNLLRSLGEMAGNVSPDNRATVMGLLRGALRLELEQRKVSISFPEERDAKLRSVPADAQSAAAMARAAQLSGLLLICDIRRWHSDGRSPLRTRVEMRLLRIDNGALEWQGEVQKIVPLVGSGRLDEASADAIKAIISEVFRS